jgi:hypothetical protein
MKRVDRSSSRSRICMRFLSSATQLIYIAALSVTVRLTPTNPRLIKFPYMASGDLKSGLNPRCTLYLFLLTFQISIYGKWRLKRLSPALVKD